MERKKRFGKLIDRLAEKEEEFLRREFLAPVVRGGEVRVRIAGVVCRLRVHPARFTGFGVFRPTSISRAELVREAGLAERQRYLGLFPLVRLILGSREGERWIALPAHAGDRRFQMEGTVPVEIVEGAQLFDTVAARFDGTCFWFESVDGRSDPARAAYLRRSLNDQIEVGELKRPGLTAEERVAYALGYHGTVQPEQADGEGDRPAPGSGDPVAERLRESLGHAGARFQGYLEHRDSYQVRYTVDGNTHVSAVSRGDLTVQSAGICLSGRDRQFDLASLVGVIREGRRGGEIVED